MTQVSNINMKAKIMLRLLRVSPKAKSSAFGSLKFSHMESLWHDKKGKKSTTATLKETKKIDQDGCKETF